MLKSPNYVDSVEKGELVPSITLTGFNNDEHGNNNPALWRIGPKNDGIYLAVTDGRGATR